MLEREPLRPVYLKELVKGVTLASYRERQRLWGGVLKQIPQPPQLVL